MVSQEKNIEVVQTEITVFPQPASDVINFELKNHQDFAEDMYTLDIFNVDGGLLFSKKLIESKIQIHDLASGTYFYSLRRLDQKTCTGKFIIIQK